MQTWQRWQHKHTLTHADMSAMAAGLQAEVTAAEASERDQPAQQPGRQRATDDHHQLAVDTDGPDAANIPLLSRLLTAEPDQHRLMVLSQDTQALCGTHQDATNIKLVTAELQQLAHRTDFLQQRLAPTPLETDDATGPRAAPWVIVPLACGRTR